MAEEAAVLCKLYFVERLLAIYLHGSIAMGDAVPYVSDLDCYIVISGELADEDKRYLEQLESRLQQKYPVINGVHLSAHSVRVLREDQFARFVLRYNAVLYWGNDIVKELEKDGAERLEPNVETAKGRLAFARRCFAQALNHEQPLCTGKIPAEPCYAARKYARYFVIVEGAYFLMSQNQFESFKKEDVLYRLYQCADGFEEELDMACEILKSPKSAGITPEEFLKRIRLFVEWMFERIEKA